MRCANNEGNGDTTCEMMTIMIKKKMKKMKMVTMVMMCSNRKYLLTSVSSLRGSMMTMIMMRRGMGVPAGVQDIE